MRTFRFMADLEVEAETLAEAWGKVRREAAHAGAVASGNASLVPATLKGQFTMKDPSEWEEPTETLRYTHEERLDISDGEES